MTSKNAKNIQNKLQEIEKESKVYLDSNIKNLTSNLDNLKTLRKSMKGGSIIPPIPKKPGYESNNNLSNNNFIDDKINKHSNPANNNTNNITNSLSKFNINTSNTSNTNNSNTLTSNISLNKKSSIRKPSNEKDIKMLNTNEKNDYQKKLTNQLAIDKYKIQCLQLLKDDDEIRQLAERTKIGDTGKFIDDYFFNDLCFQYKLELFLIQKNGNTKNKKHAFFREEIKKVLEYKILDVLFEEKMSNVISSLDKQFKSIENFNISMT